MTKSKQGYFFEDFKIDQQLIHPTERTITWGDVSLVTALYGVRFPLQSSQVFAQKIGMEQSALDDFFVFHIVFGKTVCDVSLNAVANLGYSQGVFGVPVYVGDTLFSQSKVIGLKENSNGKTGVVYVQTVGTNQRGQEVLRYCRWVMVKKRNTDQMLGINQVPDMDDYVKVQDLKLPENLNMTDYDFTSSGCPHRWNDYQKGECIDHVDGLTLEESEHQMATRLYQNNAKIHFNHHMTQSTRFGKRLIYGGHVISTARALSFNGLANSFKVVAINGGRHVNPAFAGTTVYCWSEVLDKWSHPHREDVGFLRLRMVACGDQTCQDFPLKNDQGGYCDHVLLDFDYTVAMPV